MSDPFPSLRPTTRSYSPGVYPTKVYRSLAGTTFKRSFGNKPSAHRMSVSFVNIPDSTTEQILAHYYATSAGFERFSLPSTMFAGMSDNLRTLVRSPDGIKWQYASPPAVESVYIDRSTVTVEFEGEINV